MCNCLERHCSFDILTHPLTQNHCLVNSWSLPWMRFDRQQPRLKSKHWDSSLDASSRSQPPGVNGKKARPNSLTSFMTCKCLVSPWLLWQTRSRSSLDRIGSATSNGVAPGEQDSVAMDPNAQHRCCMSWRSHICHVSNIPFNGSSLQLLQT